MKRDMDLFKKILKSVKEQQEYGTVIMWEDQDFDCEPNSESVRYHIKLLEIDGFVEASYNRGGSGIKLITNKGHDFLEFLSNQGIMSKIKEHAAKIPDLSLGAIYTVAVQFGVDKLTELFRKITG